MSRFSLTCMKAIDSLFPDDILQIICEYVQPRKMRIYAGISIDLMIQSKRDAFRSIKNDIYGENVNVKCVHTFSYYTLRMIKLTILNTTVRVSFIEEII